MTKGLKVVINDNGKNRFDDITELFDNKIFDVPKLADKTFLDFYKKDYNQYKEDKKIVQKILMKIDISPEENDNLKNIINRMEDAKAQYDEYKEIVEQRGKLINDVQNELQKIKDRYYDRKYESMLDLLDILKECSIPFEEYPQTLKNYFDLNNENEKPKFLLNDGKDYISLLIQKNESDFILLDDNDKRKDLAIKIDRYYVLKSNH